MEKIGESAPVLMVKDMGAYENFEEKCQRVSEDRTWVSRLFPSFSLLSAALQANQSPLLRSLYPMLTEPVFQPKDTSLGQEV